MTKIKYAIVLTFVGAALAGAIGLPGGGGKIDTTKIDNCIAAINDVSAKFESVKGKIETCRTNLDGIAKAHGISDVLSDLSKAATLKDALTDEEKASLQKDVQTLTSVPGDIQTISATIPDILTNQLPAALTDVVNQIQANPLKAGDLKAKQDKLNEGKAALENIATDAPATVDAATALVNTINGII